MKNKSADEEKKDGNQQRAGETKEEHMRRLGQRGAGNTDTMTEEQKGRQN